MKKISNLFLKVLAVTLCISLLSGFSFAEFLTPAEETVIETESVSAERITSPVGFAVKSESITAEIIQQKPQGKAATVKNADIDKSQDIKDTIEKIALSVELPEINTDFRSIGNPNGIDGKTVIPEVNGKLFNPMTKSAGEILVLSIILNIFSENMDRSVMRKVLEATPYIDDVVITQALENDAEQIKAVLKDGKSGGGTILENHGSISNILKDGINDLFIYMIPTNVEGIYEFAGDYVLNDGTQMTSFSGIYFNDATGYIYTKDQKGIYSTGYTVNIDKYIVATEKNCWQSNLGFCKLYDMLAPVVFMFIETVRIKFEYDNKDWMVQFWKGNYALVSNGAELGFYEKPTTRAIEFYDCSEIDIPISLKLYTDKKQIMDFDMGKTWWAAGFVPGPLYKASELNLDGTIVFEDKGMLEAFLGAVDECIPENFTYDVSDMTFSFIWLG